MARSSLTELYPLGIGVADPVGFGVGFPFRLGIRDPLSRKERVPCGHRREAALKSCDH